MTESKVPPTKAAGELKPGDRIATGFLPGSLSPADVLFVFPYIGRDDLAWVFVAYREHGYSPESERLLAASQIPVESVDDGFGYSREADDPTPVSPGRVPLHTGSIVRDSELVIDRTLAGPGLVPAPIAEHYEARVWADKGPGSCGADCACGIGFAGLDTPDQASEFLSNHIAASTPQPDGGA